jgi:undecaprenyl-diphosphatase
MDFSIALLYGLIQGVSEFLPVSSSGHLALLPYFMTMQDPGVAFDLCMHLGTALAVLVYFRTTVLDMTRVLPEALTRLDSKAPQVLFVRYFIMATLASVLVILCLKPVASYARHPGFIAFNQAFFGILLWLADRRQRLIGRAEDQVPFYQALGQTKVACLIGVAQAFAIFPGVSRSGITLTASYGMGLGRKEAGTFSFLLSLPIIIAGAVVEMPHLLNGEGVSVPSSALLVGLVTSFVVGLATIHFFMLLIARINLGWFTLYRLGLAVILCVMLFKN